MRSKFKWILTLLLAFSMQVSFAQEKTVTGTVTEDGLPMPTVNVINKSTKASTQTDFDGKYSIKAKAGDVLVFSFVGYTDTNVTVGASNVVNPVLKTDAQQLGEVVVTSQGIKKEKKALGYAVTTIKAEEFASKPSTDVVRALTGKAPGVNIQQTSGLSGSGTNIIIRGYSSITGSNQPLFVVDGVPFNSDTNSDGNFVEGATNASSRFLDLDPNNIESISILKGLSATTLYGSAGSKGVVLVTTKSGNTKDVNKKMEVSVSQSLYMTEISGLPDYQNSYGIGNELEYRTTFGNWGPSFNTRGEGGIGMDGTVIHPYSYLGNSVFPEYVGQRVEWKPQNNVKPFFRTGYVNTTSVSLSGRGESTSYNVNVGNTSDSGFIENNNYKRLNLSSGGSTKLGNGITLSTSLNYIKTDKTAPPTGYGYGSGAITPSIFATILYTPRSFDLFGLPYENPKTHESVNYRPDITNPRWLLKNASDDEHVRRFFGNFSALYDVNSWSNVSYRLAMDNYTQAKRYYINKGGYQTPRGYMRTTNNENTVFDHTFSYNFNKELDKAASWNLDGTIGVNSRLEAYDYTALESFNQFVYGFQEHQNFQNHLGYSEKQSFNKVGVYGSATLGYKKYVYLNLQARKDYFSSLLKENRSLFYPSASVSFIPTDAFTILKNNKYVNYAKLRIGYGSSAGFPSPYQTNIGLYEQTSAFTPTVGGTVNVLRPDSQLGNPNLKPELYKEIEFGLEAKFFDNRLGIDFSAYNKKSKDLIIDADLAPENGYVVQAQNVSEISNKGIELGVSLGIIVPKEDGFGWNLSGTFTKNKNIVGTLGLGVDKIAIAGFTNRGNFAIPGRPYGVIMGSSILRDANGNFIVGSDGNYVVNSELTEIGDPNADWKSTVINEISYKNITFGFQFEYQKGGDIYSNTANALLSRGVTEDTNFDRNATFVLPGVSANGNVNTVQISSTQYGFNNSGFFIDEQSVYDATNLRLREISLSYSLPKRMLEKTPFGKISIAVTGQNMWYKAFNFPKHLNFDPEVMSLGVGNGQGFDYLTGPSAKRYGFNINLTF
ncbi:SusC/RagA family TonB-linked outer membrane protein [Flavobacterium noncentrifugens]|uniref:TonB-linked outer membrane protein, SusC/RagA family n=1 Tax=Flavobacterium noncentrifugens TaxID=1128970 RepID=A0A1G8RAI5_9FLAO|nr:SusC/RagA family TonB-linked outer membrane protein [Flavobacterium noncentrifugens]SDJ13863.1 TonB-linked outer membrane protein, SusC/RagA family [Flavobacterium noncentrifugens]